MADTSALQRAFDWVRGELATEVSAPVVKGPVPLTTGAVRTFNAVSANGHLVAQIVNSSGPTSGGKRPVGKIQSALAHLYLLSLVDAPDRRLVLTDPEFHRLVVKETDGALAPGLQLQVLELPPPLKVEVAEVTQGASKEMS